MTTIACIGSGNMGFALMKAALCGGVKAEVYFTDSDFEKAASAAASLLELPEIVHAQALKSNTEAVKKCDIVFLAVKPQVLPSVLAEISPSAKERLEAGNPPVLVSMAAGWTIEKIQSALGENLPVARIMPNTPALIGKGVIALCASGEVKKDSLSEIEAILYAAGFVDRVEERLFDAVTGLSGSGPAYVYQFIEALSDAGVRAGLPRDKAILYAAKTVEGAAAMVNETGKHPGELKDMVTSPGGTTIAGIAALEEGAFRGTVMKAVEASVQRAKEIG